MTVLRSGSASDVGRVRALNEDLALETLTLFAVADGMGGHAGGEVAARTAIEALQQEFARQPSIDGLVTAVRRANQSVWDRSHEDPDLRGMGTTLTAAALVATDDGDRLVLANVGDSRSYRFHDGTLTQLTKDHSVAEELVERGELSEAEAAVHPHRHILTRALGVAPDVEVDVWQVTPEAGDRFLLCSDGLSNEISTRRMTSVLSSTPDPQQAAETLVRMANEHGGNDNVTVVVLDVLVGDEHV
ncbi:MAG: Stp1/IreP family PP2C-type Ser/Thr phosphatase, partial [Acidimicrobiales bacterium]